MNVKITHADCMDILPKMPDSSVDFTITDIPYGEVNRPDSGLRNITKGAADIMTFDLNEFLQEIYRVTKNNIVIFCGRGQFSTIHDYFASIRGGGLFDLSYGKRQTPAP